MVAIPTSAAMLFGFVALTFAGQMVISAIWLHHFRYGPLEWALRWLTNGRRPAFARRAGEGFPGAGLAR